MYRTVLGVVLGAIFWSASLQGAGAGWVADNSGCKVWSSTPQPNETVAWSGPCRNGFADGRGILVWFLDRRPHETYTGELRDGRYTGRGVQVWSSGDYYDGYYLNDQAHGMGTYRSAGGEIFSGTWVGGCFRDGGRRMAVGAVLTDC